MRRKTELENILLEMLLQQPYSEITVTHLIQKAGVSRGTFYLYFSSLDQCLSSLTQRILQDIVLTTERESPEPRPSVAYYRIHLLQWLRYQGFLSCLLRDELSSVLLREMMIFVSSEEQDTLRILNDPFGLEDKDGLCFYVGGFCNLILGWSNRNFDTPVDELAQKMQRLIHAPLLP